tara:strand:+ start:182 stop:316 length:135 start_codon:yes stop_codon:yes gene_type:complete
MNGFIHAIVKVYHIKYGIRTSLENNRESTAELYIISDKKRKRII